MRSLLKADFRRVMRDKLLLIVVILAVAFAIMIPGLYALMFSFVGKEIAAILFPNLGYAKAQFFSAFSISSDFGLIAPILLAIVLCKDFSYGTIRNKIISGKSREQIFLSLFITCSVVTITVMMVHAFLTLGFSLIFFEYQSSAFTMSDFWYFLESVIFELLALLFFTSLLSWLCASMKNVGLVIVLFVAISFLLILIGTATQASYSVLVATNGNERTISILNFVNRINIANSTSYIGTGTSYHLEDVLYQTLPALIGSAGFVGLGILKFRKKDLK